MQNIFLIGVKFDPKLTRPELWSICKDYLIDNPRYKIEAIAAKYGHIVLRMAPYHPELNPIEVIL